MYDTLRQAVQRNYSDQLPFGLPIGLAPFVCGSLSGIASWVIGRLACLSILQAAEVKTVYPVDLVKTRVQRDALAGEVRNDSTLHVVLLITRQTRLPAWQVSAGL